VLSMGIKVSFNLWWLPRLSPKIRLSTEPGVFFSVDEVYSLEPV
jgi:hypothetical protein